MVGMSERDASVIRIRMVGMRAFFGLKKPYLSFQRGLASVRAW